MTKAVKKPVPESDGLYAEFEKIHPRHVRGPFRQVKYVLMAVLMAFWHLAPFIRWDRGPDAPNQAILADMAGRRGYFFFIEIWPQEVYYITGLLMFAAIALFFMSALAGRLWCGFLCWQTVYTDLFVLVERLIIGDRNKRIALDRKPWNGEKLLKRGSVNLIWAIISFACGLSFVMFFGDAFDTLREVFTLQASGGTYAFMGIVGGFCFLLAGYGREQVCIYMCPYSRFQSAMFDEHSLIITYEEWRGEPRAPARKGQDFTGRGHCLDCRMCVQSCPTGVDIRQGSQLACIGCGLCIDACNAMMDKFGLPRGLISYDSSSNLEAKAKGEPPRTKIIRLRTILYTLLLSGIAAVMLYALATRKTVDVNILHERSPLYVQMSDGTIRNGYTYKILNMVRDERVFAINVVGLDQARITIVGGDEDVVETQVQVPGDQVTSLRMYINAPESSVHGKKTPIYLQLKDLNTGKVVKTDTIFAGPGE